MAKNVGQCMVCVSFHVDITVNMILKHSEFLINYLNMHFNDIDAYSLRYKMYVNYSLTQLFNDTHVILIRLPSFHL